MATKAKGKKVMARAFRKLYGSPREKTVQEGGRARARRVLAGVRDVLTGKLGGFAYYPTKKTPKGQEVAVFAATGPFAVRFARWVRRAS